MPDIGLSYTNFPILCSSLPLHCAKHEASVTQLPVAETGIKQNKTYLPKTTLAHTIVLVTRNVTSSLRKPLRIVSMHFIKLFKVFSVFFFLEVTIWIEQSWYRVLSSKKVIFGDIILAERFKQIHLQKQEKYLTFHVSIKIKSYF